MVAAREASTGHQHIVLSLDRLRGCDDNVAHSSPRPRLATVLPMSRPARVIEHRINGRLYRIEVSEVSRQWRARVVNQFGGPTALMPFYGDTAEAAAGDLSGWLARVHKTPQEATAK